jgi:uncharacterized protein with HEPN domain
MLMRCQRVLRQTQDASTIDEFVANDTVYDATLRNLEIIGEAARNVSKDTQDLMPDVPWRAIVGLRNVLAHGYFAIDDTIVWEIVQHRIPDLERQLESFLAKNTEGEW